MARSGLSLRERLLPALGASALALAIVGPLCFLGYRNSVESRREETRMWAQENIRQGLLNWRDDTVEAPANVWQVNPVDEWFNVLGEAWTNPPIVTLAEPAMEFGSTEQEFDFVDGQWFAYGEWVGRDEVFLAVVDRSEQDSDILFSGYRWSAVALGSALLAAAAAWFAASRMTGPIKMAHTVNRDFIADAAHELRTPLAVIQASAGHALSRERSAEDYRESLQEILDATERAGSSVGALLEFARLEAGQAAPRHAPLRLDLLTEEVAASIRVEDTTVESIPGEAVVVEADDGLIRQVIDNIARNAATRADKVTLSTHLEQHMARVDIEDTGPGFDPGIIDHVFERFRRGDRSGSAGLGLAIARTIVELHGGSCEAENREEGGARLTIRLPYKH